MKLLRELIAGNIFIDVATSGNFLMKIQTDDQSGWEDISSIENFHNLGHGIGKDYLFVRDIIKELILAKGFSNCTNAEKTIAAIYKVGTHAERFAACGNDIILLEEYGEAYDSNAVTARRIRWKKILTKVHNALGAITEGSFRAAEVVLGEVTSVCPNAIFDLVELGVGGIIDSDNIHGTLDYINATPLTPFALIGGIVPGLRSKITWIPEGYSNINEFCDDLLDIFMNGNY